MQLAGLRMLYRYLGIAGKYTSTYRVGRSFQPLVEVWST